jgi:hypothetical protein
MILARSSLERASYNGALFDIVNIHRGEESERTPCTIIPRSSCRSQDHPAIIFSCGKARSSHGDHRRRHRDHCHAVDVGAIMALLPGALVGDAICPPRR